MQLDGLGVTQPTNYAGLPWYGQKQASGLPLPVWRAAAPVAVKVPAKLAAKPAPKPAASLAAKLRAAGGRVGARPAVAPAVGLTVSALGAWALWKFLRD